MRAAELISLVDTFSSHLPNNRFILAWCYVISQPRIRIRFLATWRGNWRHLNLLQFYDELSRSVWLMINDIIVRMIIGRVRGWSSPVEWAKKIILVHIPRDPYRAEFIDSIGKSERSDKQISRVLLLVGFSATRDIANDRESDKSKSRQCQYLQRKPLERLDNQREWRFVGEHLRFKDFQKWNCVLFVPDVPARVTRSKSFNKWI